MKNLIVGIIVFINLPAFAQNNGDTNSVKLDLLKAPSSPASNLLGIAISDIEKPTDISAFMFSLQSATNSFTKLPGNYAVDFAPYWLNRSKRDYTTASLNSKNAGDIFKQTFTVSTAIRNPDSTEIGLNSKSTYAALGFKFSLNRGEYNDETKNTLNEIGLLQKRVNRITIDSLKTWRKNDPLLLKLLKNRDSVVVALRELGLSLEQIDNSKKYNEVQNLIIGREKTLSGLLENEDSYKAYFTRLKKIAESFIISRSGWSWDIAGGLSSEFINKRFDNSKLYNAGIWTTFGHTGKKGSSLLALIRYLHNPDQNFTKNNSVKAIENVSTFDAGSRYVYSNLLSRFNCSIEAIYRSILSSNTINPSWRLVINAEYAIWSNQKLTFAFGKNFDGTITKDGTLIAALNFLTGLGNKR